MSHIVTIQTEVRDAAAVRAACDRLKLSEPQTATVQFFSGEAKGLAVLLPAWRFPVVCDLEAGSLRYDNFEGRWGEQRHLDALLQMYAVEKTKIEARKEGHSVSEQLLTDGSIKLTVQVGGAA
ncbi:MAG: DUF1257 domain-containing protein [Pirellulales bacterium]